MAYEVVKTIRGRPYRYSVESYRDPESGRLRARWTYVGRGEPGAERPASRRRSSEATRTRLIDALEGLLEHEPYAAVTAGAIAAEAGLAHGTFYRQFRDKRAALEAALDRSRDAFAADLRTLTGELLDLPGERRRFAAWVTAACTRKTAHRGLARAYFTLAFDDAELTAARRRRRDETAAELSAYFERLNAAGYAPPPGVVTGQTFLLVVEGALRRTYIDNEVLSAETIAELTALLVGAVFGSS